jgi:hypothetical protein
VYDNWFLDDDISHAVKQICARENMEVYNNTVIIDIIAQSKWEPNYWSVKDYAFESILFMIGFICVIVIFMKVTKILFRKRNNQL